MTESVWTEEEADRWALDDMLAKNFRRDCCQDECRICRAFKALAYRLLAEGCTVCIQQNQVHSMATFEFPSAIFVNRFNIEVNANGTVKELIGLAHEAGHWRSAQQGTRDNGWAISSIIKKA